MTMAVNLTLGLGGLWDEDIEDAPLAGGGQGDLSYPAFISEPVAGTDPLSVNFGGEVSVFGGYGPFLSVDGRFRIGFGDIKYFELFGSFGYSYGILPTHDPLGSGFVAGAGININPFSSFSKYIWLTFGYDIRLYGSNDYTPEQMMWGGLTLRIITFEEEEVHLDASWSQPVGPDGAVYHQRTRLPNRSSDDSGQTNSSN